MILIEQSGIEITFDFFRNCVSIIINHVFGLTTSITWSNTVTITITTVCDFEQQILSVEPDRLVSALWMNKRYDFVKQWLIFSCSFILFQVVHQTNFFIHSSYYYVVCIISPIEMKQNLPQCNLMHIT